MNQAPSTWSLGLKILGAVETVDWRVGGRVMQRMTGNFGQPRERSGHGRNDALNEGERDRGAWLC